MMLVYNHKILGSNLLDIFYSFLNDNTKVFADNIIYGAFMILCWELTVEILDWVSKTNRRWHTREEKRGVGTYAIGSSVRKEF